MRSPLANVLMTEKDRDTLTDLQVLQTRDGLWYVGTLASTPYGDVFGTRDSDLFSTKEEAEHFLSTVGDLTSRRISILRTKP